VSEISGVGVADVVKASQLNSLYAKQLVTAQAISPATQGALLANPADAAAQAKAVQEIMAGLHVTAPVAATQLAALGQVPPQDLLFLSLNGAKVRAAAADLTALAAVPVSDLAFLKQVQHAAASSPAQWKNYLWIAVGGEVLFLPLIFLMAGFWSPRRARQAARDHEQAIAAEAARLVP
jgi:hypothetical protein